MKRQPIIGITTGEIVNAYGTWAPFVHGQSYTYVNAVIRAGGTPILLPLTPEKTAWRELYKLCDGILVAGGNDIDPALYGAKPDGTNPADISRLRDDQELAYIAWAEEDDKPILAICRGLQLVNVSRGGTLYQDIATELPAASDHEDSTHQKNMFHLAHQISIEPDTRLSQILQTKEIATNSHHHQGIKDVGRNLRVTARSEDGFIEAIEQPDAKFLVAVQSHPESLEAATVTEWRALFAAFIAACH